MNVYMMDICSFYLEKSGHLIAFEFSIFDISIELAKFALLRLIPNT